MQLWSWTDFSWAQKEFSVELGYLCLVKKNTKNNETKKLSQTLESCTDLPYSDTRAQPVGLCRAAELDELASGLLILVRFKTLI